jgi:hypothetical protein
VLRVVLSTALALDRPPALRRHPFGSAQKRETA